MNQILFLCPGKSRATLSDKGICKQSKMVLPHKSAESFF